MNESIFKSNMKKIRQSYELTLNEMAEIIGINSRSAICEMENPKIKKRISLEKVLEVVNIFGISMDWLFSGKGSIYNEYTIEATEKELLKTAGFIKPSMLKLTIPEYYKDEKQRKNHYNINERANIIYRLRLYLIPIIKAMLITEEGLPGMELNEENIIDGKNSIYTKKRNKNTEALKALLESRPQKAVYTIR